MNCPIHQTYIKYDKYCVKNPRHCRIHSHISNTCHHSPPLRGDLCMFDFLIWFSSCITIGKVDGWGDIHSQNVWVWTSRVPPCIRLLLLLCKIAYYVPLKWVAPSYSVVYYIILGSPQELDSRVIRYNLPEYHIKENSIEFDWVWIASFNDAFTLDVKINV
jgi:hypothetical protein